MSPEVRSTTTSPPDRIEVRGLQLMAVVGVLPEERVRAQPIEVDLDLLADLSAPGASDALEDTIDYGAVCDVVASTAASHRPELLERLVDLVAAEVLECDPRIQGVTVALRKLRPPVPHAVASTGVRVTRMRKG